MKAIDTEYKGFYFRSRLEARWAVFFDALGIKWEYEKEGFVLENGKKYLPDFYLPHVSLRGQVEGVYVEIKPDAKSFLGETYDGFTFPLCGFAGMPLDNEYIDGLGNDGYGGYQLSLGWDNCMVFMICKSCGCVKIDYGDESSYRICNRCSSDVYVPFDEIFIVARDCARSKRFEFLE
ncbi:MAG: hypothetical protein DYG86_01410 [Chloroflexi bacterium CFX2]|nr:hypothetical protein [Chloroflexi bacterium CFX2]